MTRNVIIKLLTTISIFLFVRDSSDLWLYGMLLSLGFFVSNLILWPFLFKEIPFYRPTFKECIKHITPSLILFITVLSVSLFKIMDKIMLGTMTSPLQVGYYESSEKIINVPIALIQSLGTVMLPRMTYMVANNGKDEKLFIKNSCIFAMFLASSIGFGLMGISKEFVPFFYGEGYEPCVYLYWILLPSTLFLGFANVIRTQYLLPHGEDKVYVISAIIGATTNLCINLLLIPKLHAYGAGIGTLCAEIAVCVYQCSKAKNKLPIGEYIKDSFAFVLAGLLMFFSLIFIKIPFPNYFTILIKIIFGAILYLIFLFVLLRILNTNIYRLLCDKMLFFHKED